jgi:hypothetical protein
MKLLLDTHIWLWSLLEPKRLSRRIARLPRPLGYACNPGAPRLFGRTIEEIFEAESDDTSHQSHQDLH